MRGIAALIVVAAHYLGAFYPYSVFGGTQGYLQHSSWESFLFSSPAGIIAAHRSAVAAFFILSGYVLSYKFLGDGYDRRAILASLVKRPARLVGLVYVTMIIGALFWANTLYLNGEVSLITNSIGYFDQFWQGEFRNVQFVDHIMFHPFGSATLYNPPLWTIALELYGSIFLFVFLFLFGAHRHRMYLCALVIVSLLMWFQYAPIPQAGSKLLYAGMFAGMLLADMKQNWSRHYLVFQNSFMPIFCALMGLYFASYPNSSDPAMLSGTIYASLPQTRPGVYSMMGALTIFLVVDSQPRIQSLLQTGILVCLGKVSYAVFAIHFVLLGSISSWLFLTLYPIGYGSAFVITSAISLALILGSAFILTKYVDQPVIKVSSLVERSFVNLSARLNSSAFLQGFVPRWSRFK
jgi:peptidoglycan/LPS O-acetylase OafA/YrhL